MNYKKRLTLLFVGLFFIVLTTILSFIYISYADFRKEEFFERLRQKSFSTIQLLAEVREIDKDLLKIIDQNAINKMYDEKILIFNESNELIYSSLDDEAIPYSNKLLEQIRLTEDKYYVDEDGDEVVGVHYNEQGHDYVVLASAYDQYGISKLENLRDLIIGALLGGTLLIALSSYFYIRQIFIPIDDLNKSIKVINENNLHEFVVVKKNKDELDKLALNYNQMLGRLYKAFESQRAFVRNASHELKTPLALIQGKLETLGEICLDDASQGLINTLMEDVQRQASLVESLLLMQRLQSSLPVHTNIIRIDEVLDESVRDVKGNYPALQVEVDIDPTVTTERQLTVRANLMLIKICFKNLITNVALYSDRNRLNIRLLVQGKNLELMFMNAGEEALPKELIFEPFYRQMKEQEKPGSGLGLSIVTQIIEMLQGAVVYEFNNNEHTFRLIIPHVKI